MRVELWAFIGAVVIASFAFSKELDTNMQRKPDVPIVPTRYYGIKHLQIEGPKSQGYWKQKYVLRPQWVRTWEEKKIYVAVWKYVWGSVEVKQWVPAPKPLPVWGKIKLGPD